MLYVFSIIKHTIYTEVMNRRFKLFHNIAMTAMYFYKTYDKFNIFYKAFALNNRSVNSYNIISSYLPSILRLCIEISSLPHHYLLTPPWLKQCSEPRKCSQNRTNVHRTARCLAEASLVIFRLPTILRSPQRAHALWWYKTFYNYTPKNLP